MSEENRSRILATLLEVGGSVRVRGGLGPVLWFCGVVAVACLGVLLIGKDLPVLVVAVVAVALLGSVGIAGYAVVTIVSYDRDRLMTEEYLIRSRILKLMEEKGSRKAVDAVTQKVVTKPEFIRLPDPPPGGES